MSALTLRAVVPSILARRWEQIALRQLYAIASKQDEELVDLRARLAHAENCTDHWHEEALRLQMQLADLTGREPGITPAAHLVLIERSASDVSAPAPGSSSHRGSESTVASLNPEDLR